MARLPCHLLAVLLPFLLPLAADAQQYHTDDTGIPPPGTCEVAAWYGQRSSWIQPACRLFRNFEVTAGVGSVLPKIGPRGTQYLLQGKFAPLQMAPNRNGVALIAGMARHPHSEAVPGGFTDLFAHLALSTMLAGDAVVLHLNLGWHYDQEDDGIGSVPSDPHPHHSGFGSVKLNVALSERLTAIGEVYVDHPIMPGYQLGLRAQLIPDRVQLDLSYGGHAGRRDWGHGLTLGLLVTPPPFLPPGARER